MECIEEEVVSVDKMVFMDDSGLGEVVVVEFTWWRSQLRWSSGCVIGRD